MQNKHEIPSSSPLQLPEIVAFKRMERDPLVEVCHLRQFERVSETGAFPISFFCHFVIDMR